MSYEPHSEGSMYIYDSAVAVTIDAADQYHAIGGFTIGSIIEGFTFLASATGSITDTENNGGVLRCTDVAHGLTTGQYVTLTGMGDAAHVGSTRITVISVDVFDCDDIVYNSDNDTGTWARGSSLKVSAGHGGHYSLSWSASMLSAGVNKNYKVEIVKNIIDLDEFASERKIAVANDLGSLSAGGQAVLVSGDTIWLQVQCTTDATNCTFKHANLSIHKT